MLVSSEKRRSTDGSRLDTATAHTDDLLLRTQECAQAALRKMHDLKIPTNSNNFVIWYTYFSGEYPDFCHEVNELMHSGVNFCGTVCDMLFSKYFGADKQESAASSAFENITQVLDRLKESVDEAQGEVLDFGETLAHFSESLSSRSDMPSMTATSAMMTATERLSAQTGDLGRSIDTARAAVEQMHSELDQVFAEANLDRLTKVENWKCFYSTLRQCAARITESGEALALMIIDIDGFTNFNQKFGRVHGDHLLRLVARTVKHAVAEQGNVARFGGDAFGVILPGSDDTRAMALAETLRMGFASQQIVSKHEARDYGVVTVSIGLTRYRDQEPLSYLMHRCLTQLRTARERGGNCVAAD